MSVMFRSLAIRNYRIWFGAVTVSNLGTWMQRTAQDWIVLTQLTDHDALAVGITSALQFGPLLVLTPLTGLVTDLFERRHLLIVTQLTMGMLAAILGVITLVGGLELWMMFVFALLLGIASAFETPARQTFANDLVPHDHLSNAVGLNATSFNLARLAGPAIAGLLTVGIGSGWVFVLNAATFAATVIGILLLRKDQLQVQQRAKVEPGLFRAGVAYVRGRPDLQLVFVMVALVSTLGLNMPIFISTMSVEFGGDAQQFGLLMSAMAVGSLGGALLSTRRKYPRLRTITLASLSFGLMLGAAAAMPEAISFGVALAVVGLCSLLTMNSANAYVQTVSAPAVRGRVMALYMAMFLGSTFVGAPLIGWIANLLGPRAAILVGGASGVVAALIAGVHFVRTRRARLKWDRTRRWPLRLHTSASAHGEIASAATALANVEGKP